MKKKEILISLVGEDGYVCTSDVEAAGISRTYFMKFIRENRFEKVANGIYKTKDSFEDPIYEISARFKEVIISHETAMYLYGLTEREPFAFEVTTKSNYNATGLRQEGVLVYKAKEEIYNIGKTKIMTNYGHMVNAYDRERTICDLVKRRKKTEVQTYQYAIKEYMRSEDKDLNKLIKYSRLLNCEEEIRKYLEVLT